MTNDRSGKQMGETAKKKLLEIYVKEKYGRDKELINKYITKGLQVEEDSITLYSRNKKKFYLKNEDRLENEFLCGTPDLYEGESIKNASMIIDIKSSWDLFTFWMVLHKPMNTDYIYQLQTYMDLTGAKEAKLVYCLVSTPEPLIMDEINKLKWKMGVSDPVGNEVFQQAAAYLETAMKFDDIPMEKRFIEFTIQRNDQVIETIYERVKDCRKFLSELDNA